MMHQVTRDVRKEASSSRIGNMAASYGSRLPGVATTGTEDPDLSAVGGTLSGMEHVVNPVPQEETAVLEELLVALAQAEPVAAADPAAAFAKALERELDEE